MLEHNIFSMDCLNRKAINTISSIHHLFSGMKSGSSKIVPLAKVGKVELTFKDFESLFWTYANYRKENELKSVSYSFVESSVKTSTFEIGADNVNVETIQICVGSEVSEDVFNVVDVPNEYKRRNGKAEKAQTEENKKKASSNNPSPSEPSTVPPTEPTSPSEPTVVSPSDELDNEEKALENSAKKFNGEVVKDIQEVSMRRIGLIFGIQWEDITKEQKTSLADALNEFVTMLDKGSVM